MKERCIIIPAVKKNAVIPDQLVKKLDGVTLIERALHTARAVARGVDILVVTDSQEIQLVCERYGAGVHYSKELRFTSLDIVAELRGLLVNAAQEYENVLIYRASCPLVTWVDIEAAYRHFTRSEADCLISVKRVRQRVWREDPGDPAGLLADDDDGALVESKALVMLRGKALLEGRPARTVPWFLH